MKIQFDLTKEQYEKMLNIMEITGIKSQKDLFLNIFAIIEWMVSEVQAGRIIYAEDAFIDPNRRSVVHKLVMPFLSASPKKQTIDEPDHVWVKKDK